MKKVLVCLALGITLSLVSVCGHAETKNPIKNQTHLYIGAVEFP